MTDWLQKLEAIFGARTKGDWRYSTCYGVATIESESMDIAHAVDYLTPDNASFISTAGTLGDELLAVVRAAENYPSRMLADHAWGDAEYDAARALDEALAALRAKVESMK